MKKSAPKTIPSKQQKDAPPRASLKDGNKKKQPSQTTVETMLQESKAIEEMLRERGCLPDHRHEDEKRRQSALLALEKILCDWWASKEDASSTSPWMRPRVSLVTFGSYRLRVHRLESDLDVLAIAPPSCSRSDFFSSLVERLGKESSIKDVHAIPSAYTVRRIKTFFL